MIPNVVSCRPAATAYISAVRAVVVLAHSPIAMRAMGLVPHYTAIHEIHRDASCSHRGACDFVNCVSVKLWTVSVALVDSAATDLVIDTRHHLLVGIFVPLNSRPAAFVADADLAYGCRPLVPMWPNCFGHANEPVIW